MILQKQIKEFEELKDNALISAEQDDSGTVILTRGNGLSLSFSTNKEVTGLKGDPGKQGDKGEDGLSAYDLAVLQGYKGTELRWRNSLKGPKGNKGAAGFNGTNGFNGIPISFNEVVTIKKGQTPSVKVDGNDMIFTLPDPKKGSKGVDGKTNRITQAKIVEGDIFAVKTVWNNNRGSVTITLPEHEMGTAGADGTRTDGTSPTFDKVEINRVLADGSPWSCVSNGLKGNVRYSFELSSAEVGLQGEQGDIGLPGAVTGNLIPIKSREKPSVSFASFSIVDDGMFNTFNFNDNSYSTIGFDITDSDIRYHDKFTGDNNG